MIRETFDSIIRSDIDDLTLRKGLSELRKELKEEGGVHALRYYMEGKEDPFPSFLCKEDAKVRKNTALLMGDLGNNAYVSDLYQAYEKEDKRFIKSSYLEAMKDLNYEEYLPNFKSRLEELSEVEITEENKKHVSEEMRALSNLVVAYEGIRMHTFKGMHELSNLVLLTNRDHIDVTMDQLKSMRAKAFNAGVMVETDELEEILEIRTYDEMLFMVDGMKACYPDPDKAAKTIVNSSLMEFLTKRHKGKAPFYFRIELKSKMELDKKSQFTKRLSSEIERLSKRELINSTSNYEFEIRLIQNKDGNYNMLVKLYTILDKRFRYRKEVIPASIRPTNAALTVALAKDYLKADAQILDPFCGVGTMLIERHKYLNANTMYGIDCYGDAIEKARVNTEAARQIIHYVNRDFFEFKHDYLFDEVITDMPFVTGRKTEEEIYDLYYRFFTKIREHLKEDAVLILYSHNRDMIRALSKTKGFIIEKEFEISRKEGTYVYVLRY